MGTLLLMAALAAAPQSAATEKAAALARRCIVEYNGGEFDQALVDAKKAYAIQPAPGLLYNLGQIHRALHHWEEAAFSFRAYLRATPQVRNRSTVEALIAQMEANQRARQAGQQELPATVPMPLQPLPPVAEPVPSTPPPVAPAIVKSSKPRVPRIAVLDVRRHGGVSEDIAQGVTSLVVLDVRKQAIGAAIVGADEIRAMIGLEHEKSLLGCSDSSCLAEIGGALGAERLVLGTLSRFGDNYVLDLKLLDSRSAKVLAEGSAQFQEEGALPAAVAQSVESLFPGAKPSAPVAADTSERPELTAAPETQGRSHALAWTLWAGGAVAAGFAVYGAVRDVGFQGTLNQISSGSPVATYNAALGNAWRGQANAQNWQVAALALGAVAVAAGVVGAFTW